MKLRYVILIAVALTVGPVGWGLIAQRLFRWLYFDIGLTFGEANAISIGFVAFPFFFGGIWALTNLDRYERSLKKLIGQSR